MKIKPDITLIFPDSPFLEVKTMFPPLGIMYISSYLKHFGQSVQCLDMALGHKPEDAESDLIGISFTTPQREPAFELINYFKKEGKIVVVGGPHPTHMSEECLFAGADKVFPGYGEHDLLEWMTNTKISPLSIDEIPYPDRDCLPIREYKQTIDGKNDSRPSTVLLTARGCLYNCAFCSQVDPVYRPQGVERTLNELFYLRDVYDYDAFTIYDDTFIMNNKRFSMISERLSNENFKFRCFSRTNAITKENSEKLANMGVVAVGLGVESGSDFILGKNMKGTTRKINTEAIKNLQSFGIEAKAFLIVGLPGETEETIKDTISWLYEACPDEIGVSIFQPLPGSPIFKNPEFYGLKFVYNGQPLVYRGKRGEYVSHVNMEGMSSVQVVKYHKHIECIYKEMAKWKKIMM
jgi:anaerobic magnesium-protoporphyrin IX monomethyl ester cyclase